MNTARLKSISLIVCILAIPTLFASEPDTKPTREQIIEFLEIYRNIPPLTWEEIRDGKDKRETIDLVERFGTDFSGLDLSGIGFHIGYGKSLQYHKIVASGADFSHCNMQGVAFYAADLVNCNFSNADLTSAAFWSCKLENADFSKVRLGQTQFPNAKMQNVSFADLDASACAFHQVDFSGATLANTNFSRAEFGFGPNFQKADLSNAKLNNVDLSYAKFQDALLKNTNFTNARLYLADFSDANLEGANFDGANLYAAIFIDVKGIDDPQRKSLERRSARWFYDFTQDFYEILCMLFCPGYLLIGIAAIIFSIAGLLQWGAKLRTIAIPPNHTKSFVTAFFLNGFAVFSTLSTLLMMFSGGHSVRQMSAGNWNAWSAWLHFFPIPAFGLVIGIVLSFLLVLIVFVQLFRKQQEDRPWKLFFYQVLTLAHCLLAINWLFMFMPDA